MILSRQIFEYQNQILIEKVSINLLLGMKLYFKMKDALFMLQEAIQNFHYKGESDDFNKRM